MSRSPFDPAFTELPQIIPVFPLSGVLLLPQGKLPLNVFEPRYLAMVSDALSGQRMLGMIQPTAEEKAEADDHPPLYATGCAGRIVQFTETDDGRYLITLKGACRFKVRQELALQRGYRRVIADWSRFAADVEPPDDVAREAVDRERLLKAVKPFFHLHKLDANWDAIKETPDEKLVTSLAMVCPFGPAEKQALLECAGTLERSRVLTALMEMALLGPQPAGGRTVN
ncbi:MAG: LON peptidase substrate-binding domain-containing protein [Rhodospirillales bacterium]